MTLTDQLLNPLTRATILVLWLLPCAIQDRRCRQVANRLTLPLFILAWPVAALTGHLALTGAVFVGVYVATKLEPRAGAADAKLMVGVAALSPLALGIAMLLELVVLITLRIRSRAGAAIPGALWLYVGSLLSALVLYCSGTGA